MRDLQTYSNTAFICTSRAVSAQPESRTILSWFVMKRSNRTMSMVQPPLKTYQVPSSILFLNGILVSIFFTSAGIPITTHTDTRKHSFPLRNRHKQLPIHPKHTHTPSMQVARATFTPPFRKALKALLRRS